MQASSTRLQRSVPCAVASRPSRAPRRRFRGSTFTLRSVQRTYTLSGSVRSRAGSSISSVRGPGSGTLSRSFASVSAPASLKRREASTLSGVGLRCARSAAVELAPRGTWAGSGFAGAHRLWGRGPQRRASGSPRTRPVALERRALKESTRHLQGGGAQGYAGRRLSGRSSPVEIDSSLAPSSRLGSATPIATTSTERSSRSLGGSLLPRTSRPAPTSSPRRLASAIEDRLGPTCVRVVKTLALRRAGPALPQIYALALSAGASPRRAPL